jgi:hypothetical protein
MATFFLILTALALVNLLYERVLSPSFRFSLRLRLFALRDELRELKITHGGKIDNELFRTLQGSINATINRLASIDLRLLTEAHIAFEHDAELRKYAEDKEALLEACALEEVRRIREKHIKLMMLTLTVNSGGWVPYVIPVVLGLVFARSTTTLIRKTFALPEADLNKIAPIESPA